jgi:P27 family predicted phage terminase small subunit
VKGRKRKPTNLKILQGNPGRRPLPKDEPKPDIEIPECPGHLNDRGRAEWEYITPLLYRLGLISHINRAALAAYCQVYARWEEAELMLAKTSLIIKNGPNVVANPLVRIVNQSLELMHKYLTEFGLTPASIGRVTAKQPEEQKSKWASL